MMTYKQALKILTDYFHSYTTYEGDEIHEQYIDERYKEAEEKLKELVYKEGKK